ncbi:conserved hypothetical protein [Pseudomonas sp. 8Z]|uniref:DUF1631 domain-containing protein n=1 Tax=Pseudomonas sp. 8Z TaxID=2653166 RepID=UPI0012F2F5E6|nr:DUF1631 domain-containing protein [Pseudomonas sp. 8Z]VXC22180.1 conserved hypothetical protein [Pseudomonas sp. 8Z]
MSNQDKPSPPPKVTNLASRGIQPRFGELVQSCRKLVMNRLAEHLGGVFGQVDDTLFECAEKAENNKVQTLFFDSMREIRRLRPQIERSYHQRIALNFSDFLDGKRHDQPMASLDAEHLSLVQNEDYEETLQVTNMVSRVKARSPQVLFALEQRLALLNNGQKLAEDDNPFGPQAIAQAFREALAPCPIALQIKTILYVLFDRHVMQSLDDLYSALNQRLIEGGILPNLKYSAQVTPSSVRQPDTTGAVVPTAAAPPAEPHEPFTPPPDLNAPPPSDPRALLSGLSSLLSEHRQQHPQAPLLGGTPSIASFSPGGASRTYSASELLAALNRMQQQSAQELAQRLHKPQPVEDLKVALQAQLASHNTQEQPSKVSAPEADVIDLVGMVFDFILDDANLPDSCKTALSHLHTPYLKIALQDKALFIQPQHPARRLLNTMAQAGVMYGDQSDERDLQVKMHWVVERVIQGFNGDLRLFDELILEFSDYVETLRHKVELRERRAVEAAKGRDRLLAAREQAIEVIRRSLAQRDLPTIIRNFLELTWADVLVFVLLRYGEQSEEWRRAGEVAEQLAWSGTPLDESNRQRLQMLRVPLLSELRKGLELLGGYHEDGIRRLLQDLVACQHAVQAKQPQLAAKLKPTLPQSPLGAMLGEDADLIRQAPPRAGLSSRAQALAQELAKLEFGTWFEFTSNGQSRILKLSWFSPTTHNYMFVDHQGQRVAVKPLTLLACEMEQGQARIVSAERAIPLMDRAMTAIYRVLQRFTGHAADHR